MIELQKEIDAKAVAPRVTPADIEANIANEHYFIARVCHEVNRSYCEALGDMSQPAWEDAPQWQKDSAALGVLLHCEQNVGPEVGHERWMAHKIAEGWVHGNVKDPEAKTHPCIVPFVQLPREQQAKDFIFRAIVHALRETAPAE